jgi:hypothetical protein
MLNLFEEENGGISPAGRWAAYGVLRPWRDTFPSCPLPCAGRQPVCAVPAEEGAAALLPEG